MDNGLRRFGLTALGCLTLGASAVNAGPLDPTQFASLGTLALTTPGTYVINTSGSTPSLVVGGTTYYGVVSNGIAVFDFNSITTASGTLLEGIQGNPTSLPVALLSRTTATIAGRIDVSAAFDQNGSGESNTGVGGNGQVLAFVGGSGGGGGGFGGAGGHGADDIGNNGQTFLGGVGGSANANLANRLQGGSIGGGPGSPGTGGGAIEIGAVQQVTVTGEIDAIGGDGASGGGGSGGGIFLHAPVVNLSGTLDVAGGAGGFGYHDGPSAGYSGSGGGGGGEILIETNAPGGSGVLGTILDQGGVGGGGGNGSTGQFVIAVLGGSAVPEPSSVVMLATSTLTLVGAALIRRRAGGSRSELAIR